MTIATHPRAFATVTGPTATFVTLDGQAEPVHATGGKTSGTRSSAAPPTRPAAPAPPWSSSPPATAATTTSSIGTDGALGPSPPTHPPPQRRSRSRAVPELCAERR